MKPISSSISQELRAEKIENCALMKSADTKHRYKTESLCVGKQ